MLDKRVVYVDNHSRAVEAIPVQRSQGTNCCKVTKRHWDNGQLISATIEEICEGKKRTRCYEYNTILQSGKRDSDEA